MTNGLAGQTVVVTRPAGQAETLCHLIEQQGGKALRFPTLAIESVAIAAESLQQALDSDWLIFTSTNAVNFALEAFGGKMSNAGRLKMAAVGQSTAKALHDAGYTVKCVPQADFSSEGLLAEPDMYQVAGKKITIVRGVGGREKLAETLRHRNAQISTFEVYQRTMPEIDKGPLMLALARGAISATTITSAEALNNLLAMLDDESVNRLKARPLIVVSSRIGQLATQLGFTGVTVSPQAADAAIFQTLTTLLNGENSDRSN